MTSILEQEADNNTLRPSSTSFPRKQIVVSSVVDDALSFENIWNELTEESHKEIQLKSLKEAFDHHFESSSRYQDYASRLGILGCPEDPNDIPLLSTRSFKHSKIISVPEVAVEQWYTSSGTSGTKSRVGRDRLTLERLIGSVKCGSELIDEWYEEEFSIVNLGPSKEEAGSTWFQYVLSLTELLYPTFSVQVGDIIDWPKTTSLIASLLAEGQKVGIVGPPFLLYNLCRHIDTTSNYLCGRDRITVITAGGWKSYSGERISRQALSKLAIKSLGLEAPNQVRDAFSQVELNTIFFECSSLHKHVPPWVYASARDPISMMPVADGEIGVLCYIDTSANSYPAMIMTDDIGVVRTGVCECGRYSVTVDVLRRLETRSIRGCALSTEVNLAQGN